jgi:hypothetical protein
MATTIECATRAASETNGTTFFSYGGIQTNDVFVITLSDGYQFAITNYNNTDNSGSLQVGIPTDDTINFWLWNAGENATFDVYNYSAGSLGTLIYSYPGGPAWGALQFKYNAATDELDLTADPQGVDKLLLVSGSSGGVGGTGVYYSGINAGDYDGTTSLISDAPICFLRGTRILTERGEVAVEDLREGDLVATRFSGLRPIRWIGTQSFEGRLAGPGHLPIRLRANSLGHGLPREDLLVSPGHAVLVGDVLAHAAALVNGQTIVQEPVTGTVDYFHLDLGPHDCVLANGTWAESYFDDRNRQAFHNAADYDARFAHQAGERQATCLPILAPEHPDIAAVRDSLWPQVDGMFLLADGRRVDLERVNQRDWRATIPAGTRRLRLCSTKFRPSDRGGSDKRPLGVMVYALKYNGASLDPTGAEGWYGPEHTETQSWRWSNGDAVVPLPHGRSGGVLVLSAWLPSSIARGA